MEGQLTNDYIIIIKKNITMHIFMVWKNVSKKQETFPKIPKSKVEWSQIRQITDRPRETTSFRTSAEMMLEKQKFIIMSRVRTSLTVGNTPNTLAIINNNGMSEIMYKHGKDRIFSTKNTSLQVFFCMAWLAPNNFGNKASKIYNTF